MVGKGGNRSRFSLPYQCLKNGTMRLHLDDCGPENGRCKSFPVSQGGRLTGPTNLGVSGARESCLCRSRGGALLMRPLLLHASSPAPAPMLVALCIFGICGAIRCPVVGMGSVRLAIYDPAKGSISAIFLGKTCNPYLLTRFQNLGFCGHTVSCQDFTDKRLHFRSCNGK